MLFLKRFTVRSTTRTLSTGKNDHSAFTAIVATLRTQISKLTYRSTLHDLCSEYPRETIFSGCEDLTVNHKFATQTQAPKAFKAFLVSVLQISYVF